MKTHPFEPLIFETSKALLIGTLPPETAEYYFSNSSNTRLWDILLSIQQGKAHLSKGSNELSRQVKQHVLEDLGLGIYDIIYEYERSDYSSTKDKDIVPIEYSNLLQLIENTQVEKLLFVYQNAAKWFMHSLTNEKPVHISKLKSQFEYGTFNVIETGGRKVECKLMPSPLNRGRKGETLDFKLNLYKKEIQLL